MLHHVFFLFTYNTPRKPKRFRVQTIRIMFQNVQPDADTRIPIILFTDSSDVSPNGVPMKF